MITQTDPALRYSQAIAKLLKYFNLLDTNVGLCLAHLASPYDPKAYYDRLAGQTAQQRLDDLANIVADGAGYPELIDAEDFRSWLSIASYARATRNRYIHGNWEYLPGRADRPVGVTASPWMATKLGPLANETMTLDNLEAVADDMQQVFARFMQIRQKYHI